MKDEIVTYMDTPSKGIYEAVKRIPRGRVAAYGDVAAMAGDRKMARSIWKNTDIARKKTLENLETFGFLC